MQRIVKWSPQETSEAGWFIPRGDHNWLASDVDTGYIQSFDVSTENLAAIPDLAEALSFEGKIGTIREMNHEVREGQRIFIFLVDFLE